MAQWVLRNGKILVAACLALAIGTGAGYLLWGGSTVAGQEPPAEAVGQIGKPAILPDTPVKVEYTFLLCGHTREKDETGGIYTGCTYEDVMQKYGDARVVKLDAAEAVIQRELERYCPAHYQLYMDAAGTVCIANTDEEDYTRDVRHTLEYDASPLAEEIKADLEEGMAFDTLEDINAFFESAES